MNTTLTVIVMGLIVVCVGAAASLWPASKEEKSKAKADESHRIAS